MENLFLEKDGIVVVEAESGTIDNESWIFRAKTENFGGFTGRGYIKSEDPPVPDKPYGSIKYRIRITNPGKYQLHIRSNKERENITTGNACFTRLVGDPGYQGTFIKTFQTDQRFKWSFSTRHEFFGQILVPFYEFTKADIYTFEISGLFEGFYIDRFVLVDTKLKIDATNITLPESGKQTKVLPTITSGPTLSPTEPAKAPVKRKPQPKAQPTFGKYCNLYFNKYFYYINLN